MSASLSPSTSSLTANPVGWPALPLKSLLVAALVLGASGFASSAGAATLLHIPSISGDSVASNGGDANHKEWIEVMSVQSDFDPDAPLVVEDAAVALGDVTVVKELDASSPAIIRALAEGEHFSSVNIDFVRTAADEGSDRVTYYQYELKKAIVSSYTASGDDPGAEEAFTLGGFTAGNVVQHTFDPTGQPNGRVVESFRVDPATGLARFDFVDPEIPMAGGVSVSSRGTPEMHPEDSNGDGVADRVTLTAISVSGVDGFNSSTVAHELGHNLGMTHGDPKNLAHVEGAALHAGGTAFTFGAEREMTELGAKTSLTVDFGSVGSPEYRYTVESAGVVVAEGVAPAADAIVLLGSSDDAATDSAGVTLNFRAIKWTYQDADGVVLPEVGEVALDPSIDTSITLQAVDPHPSAGSLSGATFGFGNFSRVDVQGVTAVPEPATFCLALLTVGLTVHRRRRPFVRATDGTA